MEDNDFSALFDEIDSFVDNKSDKNEVVEEEITEKKLQPTILKRKTKHIYRRAFSEVKLLETLDYKLARNTTYHCLTAGDIDSLSFLKHIIRQQNLDYLLFSTWCMALLDVEYIGDWIVSGKIKRLDAYCGEIFPGSYPAEYEALKKVVDLCHGRVCIFRNHAKIYAGIGSDFAFGIESSANINTNPRTENTTITTGLDIFNFYKEYFDGVRSFNRDFDDWKAWGTE